LLKKLGHNVTKLYPSLVQLKSDSPFIKGLHGLKAEVKASAVIDGEVVKTAEGELLFTDYGVSGNVVFQLSGHFAKAENSDKKLMVEFVPWYTRGDLWSLLNARKRFLGYVPTEELFTGLVNKIIGKTIVKTAKSLHINDLADNAKNFAINITGTTGFNYAQVTKGGISTDQIDSKTYQSKLVKNLYIVGEMLDIDGDCGGYNLTFAFVSAIAAANEIIKTKTLN
jgi:predicted Rossmann fold flavoprotein